MITVTNVSLNFSGQNLFSDVNLKFTPGNCYGVIGANGAGKSTFLKILSGELDSTTGEVSIDPNCRMSVLKQDHFAYDEYTVLDTIIMGNKRLYDIMKEKDALYEKEDFSDEDGIKAAELEAEFAEMDGWEADSNASKLMQGLGLDESIMYSQMADLGGNEKVKVLLAQALFGDPDIILLDEPTNHLDLQAIEWLEDFLLDYEGTVIVVSHDRYFLNVVCTHIVDIDYSKVKMYVGNYEFWYESSQMMERLIKQQNKKAEEKNIKEILKTNEITDIIPNNKEVNDMYLSLENIFYDKKILYTNEEYKKHLKSTLNYKNKNYKTIISNNSTFNNISITIFEDSQVIISKSSNPVIHFVIKHPKLISAIKNFTPLVKESE